MNKNKVNTIILSAGLSSRMAYPKAFLSFRNTTFIENIYSSFFPVSDKLIIVVSPQLYTKFRLEKILSDAEYVINQNIFNGRFYSIYIGIKQVGISNVFIHNVDVPGISKKTLEIMINALRPNAYVVPVYKGKSGHPILISRKISNDILAIKNDFKDYNLREFLKDYERIEVEVEDEFVVININTPSDLTLLYTKLEKFDNSAFKLNFY